MNRCFRRFEVLIVLVLVLIHAAESLCFRRLGSGNYEEAERMGTRRRDLIGFLEQAWNGATNLFGIVRQAAGCTESSPATEGPTPAPTPVATPAPTAPDAPGPTPATATFFVDYRARFKRIVDDGCDVPSTESLLIVCEKGKLDIDVGQTSPDISCVSPSDFGLDGEFAACSLDCTSSATDCDDLYIDRAADQIFGVWVTNENYAEVYFRCSGGDENSVDALYFIAGSDSIGETGSCEGSDDGDGKNLIFGELNVACPDEGSGVIQYVNTHAYSECGPLGAVPMDINGNYTCVAGDWCGDNPCTVEFTDVFIEADHHRFQQCIQSDPPGQSVPVPIVTVDDLLMPEPGQYSAQFIVGTELWYDEASCEAGGSVIHITCVDGTINLINTVGGMLCETVGSNEIQCTETNLTSHNKPIDVAEYECTSFDVVPSTVVERMNTEVSCTSSSEEQAVQFLNPAILCGGGDSSGPSYFSSDLFFECALDNEYTIGTFDGSWSCYSQIQVPANTITQFTIPHTQVFTDYRWAVFASGTCYSYTPSTTASLLLQKADVVKAVSKLKNILLCHKQLNLLNLLNFQPQLLP